MNVNLLPAGFDPSHPDAKKNVAAANAAAAALQRIIEDKAVLLGELLSFLTQSGQTLTAALFNARRNAYGTVEERRRLLDESRELVDRLEALDRRHTQVSEQLICAMAGRP